MTDCISLVDAAVRLKVGYTQIWRLALKGEIPAEKRGPRWFVSRAAVERMAAARDLEPLQAA